MKTKTVGGPALPKLLGQNKLFGQGTKVLVSQFETGPMHVNVRTTMQNEKKV